jgi:hypothetical protein
VTDLVGLNGLNTVVDNWQRFIGDNLARPKLVFDICSFLVHVLS